MSISISIVQRKGGVGKTTISTHLAAGWATKGFRVCLIDTDSQGDAGRLMGMKPTDGLYSWLADNAAIKDVLVPVPNQIYSTPDNPPQGALFLLPSGSRSFAIPSVTDNPFSMSERMTDLKDLFDVIVIDTAPTLSALDAYVYLASDYFVYVTECEALSVAGLDDGLRYVQRFSKRRAEYGVGAESQVLGIVPNKMRPSTANHRVNLELIAEKFGDLVWTPIVQRTKWTEASNFGQLIYAYAPTSGEAKDAWTLVERAEKAVNDVVA
jgi:chromosome partitioning protein